MDVGSELVWIQRNKRTRTEVFLCVAVFDRSDANEHLRTLVFADGNDELAADLELSNERLRYLGPARRDDCDLEGAYIRPCALLPHCRYPR